MKGTSYLKILKISTSLESKVLRKIPVHRGQLNFWLKFGWSSPKFFEMFFSRIPMHLLKQKFEIRKFCLLSYRSHNSWSIEGKDDKLDIRSKNQILIFNFRQKFVEMKKTQTLRNLREFLTNWTKFWPVLATNSLVLWNSRETFWSTCVLKLLIRKVHTISKANYDTQQTS